eukprot:gene16913-18619_t
MLLFWRKKRARQVQRRDGQREANSDPDQDRQTANTKKALILLITLHVYIISCAFVFQHLEYVKADRQLPNLNKLAGEMSKQFNISVNESMVLVRKAVTAAELDKQVYMRSLWKEFSKAFWFVTILFTTVGTGHIVPVTFYGRLFAILSALVGIPLYALFLKHFGDCVLQVNRRIIRCCEAAQPRHKRGSNRNSKMVLFAFFQMVFIIGMGALGAIPFDWTYFDGVYFCFISLSTVGFGDLIPDLSGNKAIYGVVYMFYNVIGLGFVSCFICTVVNAIDDFRAIRETAKWAARSVRVKSSAKSNSTYSSRDTARYNFGSSTIDEAQVNNNDFKESDADKSVQGNQNNIEMDVRI